PACFAAPAPSRPRCTPPDPATRAGRVEARFRERRRLADFPRGARAPKIHPMLRAAALMLAVLLPAAQAAGAAQSGPVTVYRCVDARGHVMLGDAPCPSGSKEEVRTMQRPEDAPRPVTPAVSALPQAPATPASVAPQDVIMRTPQPMYECTTPDGERYTSETGDGNPRWVPLWTLGYGGRHRIDASRGTARQADSIWQNVGASSPSRLSGASGGHRPSDRGR